MNKLDDLKERIKNSDFTVCIFGLGYVGLPLALSFAAAGVDVIGLDTDEARIVKLERGCSPIGSVSNEAVSLALSKHFLPTSDPSRCVHADAFILCVPTPLTASREPELCHIKDAIRTLLPFVHAGQILRETLIYSRQTAPRRWQSEIIPSPPQPRPGHAIELFRT